MSKRQECPFYGISPTSNGCFAVHLTTTYEKSRISADTIGEALQARNDRIMDSNELPGAFRIRLSSGAAETTRSNTGYVGISKIHAGDPEREAYQVNIFNLHDRKPHNHKIIAHLYANSEKALRAAIWLKNRNAEMYNRIAKEYNRLTWPLFLGLADKEAQTGQPFLGKMRGFDLDRWEMATSQVFPDGFEDEFTGPADPKAERERPKPLVKQFSDQSVWSESDLLKLRARIVQEIEKREENETESFERGLRLALGV